MSSAELHRRRWDDYVGVVGGRIASVAVVAELHRWRRWRNCIAGGGIILESLVGSIGIGGGIALESAAG